MPKMSATLCIFYVFASLKHVRCAPILGSMEKQQATTTAERIGERVSFVRELRKKK